MPSSNAQSFGGEWTREKLDILAAYLDAYTTALKNQPFNLWYVDAFAGSGAIDALNDEAERQLLTGFTRDSASCARQAVRQTALRREGA